jgi:hypothetical protein
LRGRIRRFPVKLESGVQAGAVLRSAAGSARACSAEPFRTARSGDADLDLVTFLDLNALTKAGRWRTTML